MKKYVILVNLFFCLMIIGSGMIYAEEDPAPAVSIYADYESGHYGRSLDRSSVMKVLLQDFALSKTYPIESEDGILTALVVDARIKESIDRIFEQYSDVFINPFWLEKSTMGENEVFLFYNVTAGIKFHFSLEKPGEKIFSEIQMVYADNPRIREGVQRHYRSNYVVRIFSAENVRESVMEEIDYGEVLLMATLIGDREQWLWGIHDGLGLLENVLDAEVLAGLNGRNE